MINNILKILIISFFLFSQSVHGQKPEMDKLKLEVRCYDANYSVKRDESSSKRPNFILGIKNDGFFDTEVKQQVLLGHKGEETHNDITFELDFLSEKDPIDILTTVGFERISKVNKINVLKLSPQASYLFDFDDLNPMYFARSGKYRIRFTLLKKYSDNSLTKNITTDWIYFNVVVTRKGERL